MAADTSAFLISAAHKSSGKTTVSIGLCAALRGRGLAVQPFKKGPDYIDPIWLSQAAGRSCRNLDLYLSSPESIRATWVQHARRADVSLLEGNKGLYDGLAVDGSNSNAALAKALSLPVILVIDCRGMTRGIAPLILGYQAFDADVHIAGVILNRVGGKRHEGKLRDVLAHYTSVPVLGAIPETPELALLERHLGLMPSNEANDADDRIATLGRIIEQHVDLERLLALCATSSTKVRSILRPRSGAQESAPERNAHAAADTLSHRLRVGIARDRAFGFYYPEDMEALEAAGAQLVPFDTLRDDALPEVDALFIGGGFPETLAASLEANPGLRQSIYAAILRGLPTYAECGGLMYLARSITWQGRRHEMVGIIPADVVMHPRPIGRGYAEVEATAAHPWWPKGTRLKAHEFHYSSLENFSEPPVLGWKILRGTGLDGQGDGLRLHNLFASYTHLRTLGSADTPGQNWAAAFVAFARNCSPQLTSCTSRPDAGPSVA